MSTPRKPAAFRIEPAEQPIDRERSAAPELKHRKPRSADVRAVVTPAAVDVFEEVDEAVKEPPPAPPPPRRSRVGAVFMAAAGLLLSIAVGLWIDGLIRNLFQRADWLGWAAATVAATAAASLVVIIARELMALARLRSIEKLREKGVKAADGNDPRIARELVEDLLSIVASRPETAAGRRELASLRDDVIDGGDLVRLAELRLLAPLDEKARVLVLDAAKRVSLVTAISPRALVDIAYVAFESARLIRRIADLYGGRPGTLGFLRLSRTVLAHLAVTGSIAVGDSFVQQIVGHGLAARLSAKLGEGVVNGMMTARIGIAAMEASRPLAFDARPRPRMGDFLTALASYTTAKRDVAAQPKS